MTVEGRGVGDRVQPVERVRQVDEPALLADRLDRVPERHAARDLLLEEEPDHLALAVGLDLLAGNDDQLSAPRELDRLERAAEGVVVGDRDPSEPDLLARGRGGLPPGSSSRATSPCACGDRRRSSPGRRAGRRRRVGVRRRGASRQARVERVELLRDDIEALALGALPACSPRRGREAPRRARVARPLRRRVRGSSPLSAIATPAAAASSASRCLAVGSGDEDRRLGEDRRSLVRSPHEADVRPLAHRAWDRGPKSERLRVQERQLPVGEVAEQPRRRRG